ncbi:MAG: hypothetical protein KH231_07620 [Dialister sp.]|nr:hypothetical protein [Dialister sp.]
MIIDNVGIITESDQKTNRYIVEASDEWDAIRQVQYKIHNFSNWCIQSVEKYKYEDPGKVIEACSKSALNCGTSFRNMTDRAVTVYDAVQYFKNHFNNRGGAH